MNRFPRLEDWVRTFSQVFSNGLLKFVLTLKCMVMRVFQLSSSFRILKTLLLCDTSVSKDALAEYHAQRPDVEITAFYYDPDGDSDWTFINGSFDD